MRLTRIVAAALVSASLMPFAALATEAPAAATATATAEQAAHAKAHKKAVHKTHAAKKKSHAAAAATQG